MLAGTVLFQSVIFYIAPHFGWMPSNFKSPVEVRASFLLLSGTLGFVIGYIVPSAAAEYLQQASLIAPVDLNRPEHFERSDLSLHS